jgi:hypothetical protein
MKLKNVCLFFTLLFAVTTVSARSLHPDTYVQPLLQILVPAQTESLFFSVKDGGTVATTISDFSKDGILSITPNKVEDGFFFLSHNDLEVVLKLINKLRYAKTMTKRFSITCMAMPSPLYTSYLKIRDGGRMSTNMTTMEHKIGPCAKEITSLVDQSDIEAKNQLIKILKSYL